MKVTSVEFVKNVAGLDQIPNQRLPEIAFAGRSNVGKSSLLNRLVNRKKIALISKKPGKTRLLNYYMVNEKFYFVDLPGYGFARVSQEMQEKWGELIESYLKKSRYLRAVVVITDSRHGLTEKDSDMIQFLRFFNIPFILVATKTDKLSSNRIAAGIAQTRKKLSEHDSLDIFPFSSVTGRGKNELWNAILNYLK